MARFGQQASDLRKHLRQVEEERDHLQAKLKSSTQDKGLHREVMNMNIELDELKSKLFKVEKERDSLNRKLQEADAGKRNWNSSDENNNFESPPSSSILSSKNNENRSTERLMRQNRILKKHLTDIRSEMKRNLSPGRTLDEDLESSIIAVTSGESSSPTTEEIANNNKELRRKLEHENKILNQIVDKVKADLRKAGLETPKSPF
jgi:hypothetical protein